MPEPAQEVIDRWLDRTQGRELFSAIEVRDMLLDIRAGLAVEDADRTVRRGE